MSNQKNVLITGGSSGLGLACAQSLSLFPQFRLFLGARDPLKGRDALVTLAPGSAATTEELNLSSIGSVRQSIERLTAGPRLDGLVCNAGIHRVGDVRLTPDGLEEMFAVNHVAHQALVTGLLGHFNPGARIVVVSSGTHDPDTLERRGNPPGFPSFASLAQGLDGQKPMSAIRRYSSSKLCNVLFALELDRRLKKAGQKMTVNAYDPGAVPGTALTRDFSPMMRALMKSSWILRLFGVAVSTPQRAGEAMARLIHDPTLAGVSGAYFQLETKRAPSKQALDADLASQLFDDTQRRIA